MKFITNYKELGGDDNICLLEHISKKPIKGKEKILEYLKNGQKKAIRCSSVYDYVKDEPLLNESMVTEAAWLFTDGEFNWDSEEIYHFEKYNIELNKEFLKKIEDQYR